MTVPARIRICEVSPDSPALLGPRLGIFAPPSGAALGAMARMIFDRHPAAARGGALGRGRGAVRLVMAPLSGSASKDELLLVSSSLASDAETTAVLRDHAARGGRHLFVQFERGEADLLPHLVWEHLAQDWPDVRLPDGLLWGLPCGFGRWTRELYRLSSTSNGEGGPGFGLILGGGAPSVLAANVLRYGSPDWVRLATDPATLARALRFLVHLAEDVLAMGDQEAARLIAALAPFEADAALNGKASSPTVIAATLAGALSIPASLAFQLLEASLACACAGVADEFTEPKTRFGVTAMEAFFLLRERGRDVSLLLDGTVRVLDLSERVAHHETIYVLAEPRTVLRLSRGGAFRGQNVCPAVIPDPNGLGGDLAAILTFPAGEKEFDPLAQAIAANPGALLQVDFSRLGGEFRLQSVSVVGVHALHAQLGEAQEAIRRLLSGGWLASGGEGARLRIAGVLPLAGDEGEDDQASGSKARKRPGPKVGSKAASQAKPKTGKGGRGKR
ncbi:hypothetical protein [Thermoflexus sp.]|uniref:hypothetical protein n=1 Tax=Thermoflexus sp. TaxID=1969742 RepID=UPI003C003142